MESKCWTQSSVVSLTMEPWCAEFINEIISVTNKALENGMPVELGSTMVQVCRDVVKSAVKCERKKVSETSNVSITLTIKDETDINQFAGQILKQIKQAQRING